MLTVPILTYGKGLTSTQNMNFMAEYVCDCHHENYMHDLIVLAQ